MEHIKYSGIPLNWHPQDWTDTRLLDIPGYQMVPTLTQVLIGNFLLLLLYVG